MSDRQYYASVGRELLRFFVVGAFVAGIYMATMMLMVDLLHFGAVSGAIVAFAIGTLISYVGNARMTFQHELRPNNFVKFATVVLIGLAINVLIARGLEIRGWNSAAISLVILSVVPMANFLGHKLWTFR